MTFTSQPFCMYSNLDKGPAPFGAGSPEAVTQGCQFLYLPGENTIFEEQIRNALEKAKHIQDGTDKSRLNNYELGHMTWMTFLQEKLAERFPERFKKLSSDGEKNLQELSGFVSIVASLRRQLGEKWPDLRRELMKEPVEYDPTSQFTIIRNFKGKAPQLGFNRLINP